MKRYGDTKTNLELSAKALAVYAETDPLDIIENEDGMFSIRGIEERDGLTAEEVNKFLEDLASEIPLF